MLRAFTAPSRVPRLPAGARLLAALAVVLLPAAGARAAAIGDARPLAQVPPPGQPEGLAVDQRDGSFWTGSNRERTGGVVWHFAADGQLLATYAVAGHRPALHGINGIALDGDGRAYVLDYSGARAVRIDPRTSAQEVYATFPDLPLCTPWRRTRCEPSLIDRPAWPNWPTFAADGTMYVSDLNQATIWAVPPGGGTARVWAQSSDYASLYSLNGMQLDATGGLNVVLTLSLRSGTIGRGVIYRYAIAADGSPGARTVVARTGIGDGLAIGASGSLYAPLSEPLADRIDVVDPRTGARVRSLPSRRGRSALPYAIEAPASVAFRGTELLVTNHALYSQDPHTFAVFAVQTGEPGLPLHAPRLP